ncbi:MAG: adenosylcobinamide-GDP ribazoletransferase [Lachnospiraceae bacterium]|nr:adenosylcobinamide-GDP ribazoletransferase [Lachnospiraceae bacterium]MBQ7260912.1 adenosylcobinamide-GDP ribazoletransferase [Lachnospiraceae bacterium]HAU99886.1 adenosylcobinamide-GDP ribazoletransferase [Lachnospiraceae bacterium]
MKILDPIIIAFSTYTIIPMPERRWSRENMRLAMCFFPLAGAVAGGLLWLWNHLCLRFSFPELLRAAGLTVIPVIFTGGIHLDGYMDTCDALSSHGDKKTKLSILKDPHAGAFAVIRLACLFLILPALWQAYPAETCDGVLVSLILVFSRCLSGLSVLSFPIAEGSGMAASFSEAASESGKLAGKGIVWLQSGECVLTALLLCLRGIGGILCAITGVIVFLYYKRMSLREFGGLNGDQAGWFLTLAETWMLAAAVFYSLMI